jgi:diguanylate cyclase (GGDEF)-like protein
MNIVLVPDLAAMASLLAILCCLRRRHLQEGVGLWIVGLLFIFLEAIAYALYTPFGPRRVPCHVIALDSYVAAGAIFLWAAAKASFPRRETLVYLGLNTAALVVLETLYGLDVHTPRAYQGIAGCGLILGLITPFLLVRNFRLGKGWWLMVVQLLLWLPVWEFGATQMFRDAAYYPLFLLYLLAAILFNMSLPRESLGRIVIVVGFLLWSLVFLVHSWVSSQPQYIQIAGAVWDWQKFLVTIGMLLVLLERQVATNAWYALHDLLTGLPNRRCFDEKLEQALKHAQRTGVRTAVVMIDLDGFKAVNDTRGHDTGDLLLQFIAKNMKRIIRPVDTLARLGGDEFILLMTNLPSYLKTEDIVAIARNRVAEALSHPFLYQDESFMVSASVGVAICPEDTTDEVLLRRLADQRMYEQKSHTRMVPA